MDQTTALEGKTLGVYIDASRSDACKDFTPALRAVYEKLRDKGKSALRTNARKQQAHKQQANRQNAQTHREGGEAVERWSDQK